MLQNENRCWNFSTDEVEVTVFHILRKKCFAETWNIFSLRWALEVTSGTDTRNGIGFMILSSTDRGFALSCDFDLSFYWKSFGISVFLRERLNYFFQAPYASMYNYVSI